MMTRTKPGRDVLSRYDKNPLIKLQDVPFRCSAIWNAAITSYGNRYIMLVTIEELGGDYGIYKAESTDKTHFTFAEARAALKECTAKTAGIYENRGIRDARITAIDGTYYITYVAESNHGHRIGLVSTCDFRHYECFPYASQVDEKNGPLFPRLFNGNYCLLKRPAPGAGLWISFSEDLTFWGGDRCIMTPRGGFWDTSRIGPAGPPLETEEGWLLIYYGVKVTSAGPLVRLGAAMLDREEPWIVRGRSSIPILGPREKYERLGDIPNVVFSCGGVVEDGVMHVYYGASDSCICRASAPVSDIVEVCLNGRGDPEYG